MTDGDRDRNKTDGSTIVQPKRNPATSRAEPDELDQLVAEAWRVFGFYRVTHGLVVCTCPVCMSEETRREIIATPVAQLPVALIRAYSDSAHGVPANQGDMKALLPRYLELIAEGSCPGEIGWEVALSRFGNGRAEAAWPEDESLLLDRFLRASILHAIGGVFPDLEFEEALIMGATGGLDLTGMICAVLATSGGLADVAQLLSGGGSRLVNPFWESSPKAEKTIICDIASADVQRLARQIFLSAEDDVTAENALRVIEAGERLAQKAEAPDG